MTSSDYAVGTSGTVNAYTRAAGLGNGDPSITANLALTGTSFTVGTNQATLIS